MSTPGNDNKNHKKDVLSTLLSDPDKTIKLLTLVGVVVAGGGNLFATKNAERLNEREAQQAIREIHELHTAIDSALDRQKEMLEYIRDQKRKNP
jgi:hypothetical protein